MKSDNEQYIYELETQRMTLIQDIFILTRKDMDSELYEKVLSKWRKEWSDIEIKLPKTN